MKEKNGQRKEYGEEIKDLVEEGKTKRVIEVSRFFVFSFTLFTVSFKWLAFARCNFTGQSARASSVPSDIFSLKGLIYFPHLSFSPPRTEFYFILQENRILSVFKLSLLASQEAFLSFLAMLAYKITQFFKPAAKI